MNQPLEQFEIYPLGYVGIASEMAKSIIITNFEIYYIILIGIILTMVAGQNMKINEEKTIVLQVYEFVGQILKEQLGIGRGQYFFVYLMNLFMFILIGNVIGLIPKSFCLTSQILVTFTLSLSAFVGIIYLSFFIQGIEFFYFFVPKNVPKQLIPFLTFIEVVSYISRVFSLAIRLFANMVAGHALLHILSNSFLALSKTALTINFFACFVLVIPLSILCAIVILEFGIAFLQAYVFIVLVSIYLNDAFGGTH
jgi:ATP synthase subunit 6